MSPDLLEEILVETRPTPDPGWAAELDRRAERGFERPARPSWRSRLGSWRPMLLPALGMAGTVLLVVVLVVSSPGGGDVSDSGGGREAATSAAEPSAELGREDAPSAAQDGGATGLAAPDPGTAPAVPGERRKVERFASLTLSAPPGEIAGLSDRVIAVTDRLGGYVASSSVTTSEDGGGGTLELKIPVRRLDRAMADLSELAHVAQRSQATQDITGSYNAGRARLREARTERQSLLRQLADADTPNETASIRARLRIVAAQIAAARREVRSVSRRAAYATVTVTLAADADAPGGGGEGDDDAGWTPGDALRDAGRVLEVAAGVAIVALAAAVPLGVLIALGLVLARWATHRRREAALDASA